MALPDLQTKNGALLGRRAVARPLPELPARSVSGDLFPDPEAAALLDALDQPVAWLDGFGCIIRGNQAWLDLSSSSGRPLPTVGDSYLELFRKEVRESSEFRRFERRLDALLSGRPVGASIRFAIPDDGQERWIEASVGVVTGSSPARAVVSHADIGAERHLERELLEERQRSRVMLDSIADAVIRTSRLGRVEFMNRTAEELTGYSMHDARQRALADVCRLVDGDDFELSFSELLHEGVEDDLGRLNLRRCDGRSFGVCISNSPIVTPGSGRLLGYTFVLRDVTRAREVANELERQARIDPLTDLMNRREFRDRLAEEIEMVRGGGRDREHVLCYLDLDQFKIVNDTCGHTAGDELLRQVARILCREVRASDIVARLGGDEFALLLRGCDLAQASRVCDSVRRAISSHRFGWETRSFRIGVSIGVVSVRPDGLSIEELLSSADSACYAAKHCGRNRVHVHRPGDLDAEHLLGGMDWVSRIERAIDEDRLRVFAQPIRPVASPLAHQPGSALELLVRLESSEGETICPGAFLPAAERYGKVQQIDAWMLGQALELLSGGSAVCDRFGMLTVNLSGLSLCDPNFITAASVRLEGEDAAIKERLCFEITETAVISNLTVARQGVDQLRAHGCQIALDDFGSGLSSFVHLRALNVDFVKIDGSFVENLDRSQTDLAIVQSINEIAHTMGKQTVAEFAAGGPIMRLLREIGVDYVQGNELETAQPIDRFLS